MGYIEELLDSLEKYSLTLEGIAPAAYLGYRKRKIKDDDNIILYDVTYQPLRFPPGSQPPTRD